MSSKIEGLRTPLAEAVSRAGLKGSQRLVLQRSTKRQPGDVGIPCFPLAAANHMNPMQIASKLEAEARGVQGVQDTSVSGGFLWLTLERNGKNGRL